MFVNKIKAQNKKKVLLRFYLLPPVSMLWKFNAAMPNCSEKSELYQKNKYIPSAYQACFHLGYMTNSPPSPSEAQQLNKSKYDDIIQCNNIKQYLIRSSHLFGL